MNSNIIKKSSFLFYLFILILLTPSWAVAETAFNRIVVFGTSLSDPGNAFALEKRAITPPYNNPQEIDPLLIPAFPYSIGGHHFSNGSTWVEQFAKPLGLAGNTRPAFQGSNSEATNYAVGGARAHENGINVNLSTQVNKFLADFNGSAPSGALYIIEIGGNDIRDALAVFSPPYGYASSKVITDALTSVGYNIQQLYQAGARKFLVWNVPNLRLTPAIRRLDSFSPGAGQLAEFLTQSYNSNLNSLLGLMGALPGIEIVEFNAYQKLADMVAKPLNFDLTVVDSACITQNSVPPFSCEEPEEFLFWDGIHPTTATHGIIAHLVAKELRVGQQQEDQVQ